MMRKRVFLIIGIAFAVGAGILLFFLLRGQNSIVAQPDSIKETFLPTESIQTEQQTDPPSDDSSDSSFTFETRSVIEDYSQEITPYRLNVSSAADAQTGEELSLRVVLGAAYSESYLSFDANGTFELSLASSDVKRGEYTLFGDIISIVYDDGRGAEYRIVSDDGVSVRSVMVPYGEYQIYFS